MFIENVVKLNYKFLSRCPVPHDLYKQLFSETHSFLRVYIENTGK